ncbi:MAG: polysaccharide biosynthesis/export family protein [Acidobacteriota bacterium]
MGRNRPRFELMARSLYRWVVGIAIIGVAAAPTVGIAGAQEAEPSTPEAPRVGLDTEYRLGAGDVLSVDVFGLEELDRKVRVSRDGTISLPLLGTFPIADLTQRAAEQLIARMLKEGNYVREPQVSIFVEEIVSRTVSIQGAVRNPGSYPLAGRKTLLAVIGEAGGLRQDAGGKILVLRHGVGGDRQRFELDTDQLTIQGDLSLDIELQPADVVMIPAARGVRVYVTGAVERPGKVDYLSNEGITVLQAITAAGGPTARANLKNVHILRQLADGTQDRIKVNVARIQKGKLDDVVLQRNDTVVVGEWFF